MTILIVGLGSMGKRRARLCRTIDGTIRIAGVDSAPARREEAMSLGVTNAVYGSIPEAIEQEKPTAALVCTAPLTHATIIQTLLENDLHVFTELNLVDDGYVQNMALAKEKNLTLFLSSTKLYRKEVQYIKEQTTAFSKPLRYMYHVGQYLPNWHPWENYKDFFVGNVRTGGVREILAIEFPWLIDTFGEIDKLSVQKSTISDLGLPYPDCTMLMIRHRSGTCGTFTADVVSPKATCAFECFGDGLHLFWEGNPRSLFCYENGDKKAIDTYADVVHDSRYSDNIVENAYVDELLNFFEVLDKKAFPRYSFEKDLALIPYLDIASKGEQV